MKRLVAVVALSSLLSVSAFAVLATADRQLGLPLPYSIPWSFTVVSIVAPAVFAIANAIRMRRPIVIHRTPVVSAVPGAMPEATARRTAEGLVLLDFSDARKLRERAA
jgi:hypothetical protein